MKSTLRRIAAEQGFDLCRIAPCGPPPHAGHYHAWLAADFHGGMEWMERARDKRSDPALVLEDVKSAVVLAMNYWQGPETPHRQGRIARYAWGDDYHDLMLERMRPITAFLEEQGGIQKAYVDTGPVLERDFAAMAGIGWHGKSTMLLNRTLGTWFFLGEILTTLSIEPDVPEPERCGTCTRCITACPTNAIVAPHQLDARRCISYLTIEHKGPIPEEFREAIGDRIYGCDACLDACPWNRFAAASRESSFAARTSTAGMCLSDYLALDDEGFRTLFRKSPIKRVKRPRFLRNVCVALGNVGTSDDIPALTRAASDPDPLISEHAQWALERITNRQINSGNSRRNASSVPSASGNSET